MSEKIQIILASGSGNREEGMRSLGIPFLSITPNADEKSIEEQNPALRVEQIARLKANKAAQSYNGVIIAADTINYFCGKILEKPIDTNHAVTMLEEISGQTGTAFTGICILNTVHKSEVTTHRVTPIRCRELQRDEIIEYATSRPVTDWAAAYNPLDSFSASIFKPLGDYAYGLQYGLPMDVIAHELSRVGIVVDLSRFQKRKFT